MSSVYEASSLLLVVLGDDSVYESRENSILDIDDNDLLFESGDVQRLMIRTFQLNGLHPTKLKKTKYKMDRKSILIGNCSR